MCSLIIPMISFRKSARTYSMAEADAIKVYNAVHGLGTDEKSLVDVFAYNSNEQLQKISQVYKDKYGESMAAAINLDTSGDFCDFLIQLLIPCNEIRTFIVNRAVILLGTDEQALIDVFAHASNEDVEKTKKEYHRVFQKDVVNVVSSDTSGNFKKVIVSILEGTRDTEVPEYGKAEIDAEEIYKRGEGKWGTDDEYFVAFFTKSSFEHIHNVDKAYQEKYKHNLAKAIDNETSGFFKDLLTAIVTPDIEFWAHRIHFAVHGLGTKDDILKRVFLLNNSHERLGLIAEAYQRLFGKSLADAIHGDTSGNYRDVYLGLLKTAKLA